MTIDETALSILRDLIAKSGVRAWDDAAVRESLTNAAIEMAAILHGYMPGVTMALPDVFRTQTGTAKVIKNSGGDAAITLASLANGNGTSTGARQCVKLDLGASRAPFYRVKASFEIAATPTAGATIDLYWAPSESATAGTDNPGNVSGTDAAYTGYSNNISASVKHLLYIGSFICTAQATTTVQYGEVGRFSPPSRYGSLVVYNASGAALHSTDTNQAISLIPIEDTIEDS